MISINHPIKLLVVRVECSVCKVEYAARADLVSKWKLKYICIDCFINQKKPRVGKCLVVLDKKWNAILKGNENDECVGS